MRDIYAQRRSRVLEALEDGVLIVPSAPTAVRNNDVEHEYRQDSDFFYLTGFEEPDSVLVLKGRAEKPYLLFVRPRNPEREVWDGPRAGVEGACSTFAADEAHPVEELDAKLFELLQGSPRLYYQLGRNRVFDERLLDALAKARARAKRGISYPTIIIEPGEIVHRMRLIKGKEELEQMRRAVAVTAEAHLDAMAKAAPGVYEHEVEAVLLAAFRRRGAERLAYGPIVGSGPNATVLHYRKNNRQCRDGELLLIDAGCELGYYAADVTRTFPVSGRFSQAQREIYEIVLASQLAAIEKVRPGRTLNEVHDAALHVIVQGLMKLGFFEGSEEKVLEEKAYQPYFMHKTSHYLGMDVHDVGPYYEAGEPCSLAPNTVITVEPGIYIAVDAKVPEQYRGLGVRIEDDVRVRGDGCEILSAEVPKTVAELEQVCAG